MPTTYKIWDNSGRPFLATVDRKKGHIRVILNPEEVAKAYNIVKGRLPGGSKAIPNPNYAADLAKAKKTPKVVRDL